MASLAIPTLPPGRPGDPGLFGPDSQFWRVNRERAVTLGGPAAALMQVAHPLVAVAVDEHSDRTRTPLERLAGTVGTLLTVIFGDAVQAASASAHVRAIHDRTRGHVGVAVGEIVAGTPYDATDPDLLLWALATTVHVGLGSYERFVRPLSAVDRDRYVLESRRFAEAFELDGARVPSSFDALESYVEGMCQGSELVVDERARRLAREIMYPVVPLAMRAGLPLVRYLTGGLLPERLRRDFGFRWGTRERWTGRAFAASLRASARVTPDAIRSWPHERVARRRVPAGEGAAS